MSLYRGPSIIGESADNTVAVVLSAISSATNAANAAAAASTSEVNAQSSEEAAAASALQLALYEGLLGADSATAEASRIGAVAAAAAAVTSKEASAASALAAKSSENTAVASQQSALVHLNDFRGRWYGSFSVAPTVDPLGNPPSTGDAFYDSALGYMRFYNGASWDRPAYEAAAIALINADVATVAANRTSSQAAMNGAVAEVTAGKETALSVGIPAAIASVAAITNRGTWAADARTYAIKDIVLESGTWYICVVAHSTTLTSVFATDEATKWRVYQGMTSGDLGYTSLEVQGALDNTKPLANYTALRSYTGRATGVRLTDAGLAGIFQRSATDTTSADNGGFVIVDGSGRRWIRLFTGAVDARWFGAKGDGVTDETASLQAAMIACCDPALNHCKALHIPPGQYKVSSRLTIPATGAGNFDIQAHGARMKATVGLTDYMLALVMPNYNGNNLKVHGLILDGAYTAKGIFLNGAQEWALSGVKVLCCMEGIRIEDSYYGEIANESIIRDCLVGLTLGDTLGGEVNTIKFDNIKINFAAAKTLFVAKNGGETLADYNTRVPSIGVNIQSMLLGTKFKGLTCEGMDYGFMGMKHNLGEVGASYTLFKISECYFEAIKVAPISIRSNVGYGVTAAVVGEISNCHFADNLPCLLGPGRWRMFGNGITARVKLFNNSSYRVTLTTDIPKANIEIETADSSSVNVEINYRTTASNPFRHSSYGDVDTFPAPHTQLAAVEDDNVAILPALLVGTGLAEYNRVMGVTARPLTFAKLLNKVPNGPVIVGDDGLCYMLGTVNGTALRLTRVHNLHRLERQLNCYDALELYRNTSLPAGQYKVAEFATSFGAAYRITKNGAGKLVHTDGSIMIGTGVEIAAQVKGASYGSPMVWNAQINSGYNWYGDQWVWGPDWFGAQSTDRAIGTAAQRPVTPTIASMVYYATDTATYTEWKNAAWGAYIPLF